MSFHLNVKILALPKGIGVQGRAGAGGSCLSGARAAGSMGWENGSLQWGGWEGMVATRQEGGNMPPSFPLKDDGPSTELHCKWSGMLYNTHFQGLHGVCGRR